MNSKTFLTIFLSKKDQSYIYNTGKCLSTNGSQYYVGPKAATLAYTFLAFFLCMFLILVFFLLLFLFFKKYLIMVIFFHDL